MKQTVDLAVLGAGVAGVSAAITAAQRGLNVLVLEKDKPLGRKSSNVYLNAVDPFRQLNQNIEDSAELFYRQTLEYGENRAFPNLVKTLCYNSTGIIQWLEELATPLEARVVQVPESLWPRTHLIPFNELRTALLKRMTLLAVPMVENKTVNEVQREKSLWRIKTAGGSVFHAKNLLISCGSSSVLGLAGKAHNHVLDPLVSGLIQEGAAVTGSSFVDLQPEDEVTEKFLRNPAEYVLVDGEGKRFVNETAARRILFEKIETAIQPVLCIRFAPIPDIADSIKNIAKALSTEAAKNLSNTISDYNRAVASGKDYLEDGRQPDSLVFNLNPETAVYKTIKLRPRICLGGLVINEKAQVLGWDGKPLPGLFAAGGVVGGIHGRRAVNGNELLASLVFGKIAGNSVNS